MPLVDKPIEELLKYEGINPRPEDFDEYWEAALEEMRQVDPQVELVEVDLGIPTVTCYELYFTGVRNARIHGRMVVPKELKKPAPAIIQFHGYSGWGGEFSSLLQWAACGFVGVNMDCRGQGGYSEDTGGVKGTTHGGMIIRGLDDCPENLLFRHVFLDTAELADIVMNFDFVDQTRVGVTGGSQGGALSLACASLEPRVAKVHTCYPFLSDYKRVWEMDCTGSAYEELRLFFRYHDPRHEMEEEYFTRLGYIDIQHMVHRIKADVLWATALRDQACPASTQFAAYNKLTSKKQMVLYPDFGHEFLPDYMDKCFEFISF